MGTLQKTVEKEEEKHHTCEYARSHNSGDFPGLNQPAGWMDHDSCLQTAIPCETLRLSWGGVTLSPNPGRIPALCIFVGMDFLCVIRACVDMCMI